MIPEVTVLLAAGASCRMGRPKMGLEFRGGTLLEWQCRVFGTIGPVVVVVAPEGRCLAEEMDLGCATLVTNEKAQLGMFSSVQAGLRAVPGEAEGVLIHPVDCPLTDESVPKLLCQEAKPLVGSGTQVAVPVHGGQRGHPVWLSPSGVSWLLNRSPGAVFREALARLAVLEVLVHNPQVTVNLNTPRDYEDWLREYGRVR